MPKHVRAFLTFVGWLMSWASASGQCPQAGFTIPDTVCINQALPIVNTSTSATRYEWDFCSGDLQQQPTVQTFATLPAANTLTDLTTVFDGTNWYGFASSRENFKLFRLDFGNSLDNTPAIVELPVSSFQLGTLEQIKFIREDGNWYALMVHYYTSNYVNAGISRLSFGNSLTAVPTVEKLGTLDKYFKDPRGIDIAFDLVSARYTVLVANDVNNFLVILNFGSSIRNTPSEADVIVTGSLPRTTSGLVGISVIKECNQWYGVAASYKNGLYKLSFGASLFNAPVVEDISNLYNFASYGPCRVSLINEEGNYAAYVMTLNGILLRYGFGNSLQTQAPAVRVAGSFVGSGYGLDVVRSGTDVVMWAPDWFDKKILKFSFPVSCAVDTPFTDQAAPGSITYSQSGWQKISLKAYDARGNVHSRIDSVFVRSGITADFSTGRQCEGGATAFATNEVVGNRITEWSWNFGDGATSNAARPEHTYATAGTYAVSVVVKDLCGNAFTKTQPVRIYKNTVPGFSGPTTFCSDQPVAFADLSAVIDDTPVSRQWDFGNGSKATGANVSYTYPEAGNYTITLAVTGTSGCTVSTSRQVQVTPGVNVKFTESPLCTGSRTQFTDRSTMPAGVVVVSRTWTFGDGTSSGAVNPVHEYAATGTYPVTLTTVSSTGCTNTLTKSVTIRKLPRPAFSLSLACSGETVSFTDESSAPEGNIAAWQWNFGDSESENSNTSDLRNPQHTFQKPGTYQVKLKVFTNFGCADSVSQTVTVARSPQADFEAALNCPAKTVTFTSLSSAGGAGVITDWYWDFGDGNIATTPNPSHRYRQAGAYVVTHIVTSDARCRNVFTKTIQVYDLPKADFALPVTVCAGKPVTIEDKSVSSPGDPIVTWQWQVGTEIFTEQSPSVALGTAGRITLVVTTASGCRDTVAKEAAVPTAPRAAFGYGPSSALEPLKITFTNNSNGAEHFLWDFGDGQTSQLSSPVHAYSSGGVYPVRLTARNAAGCTDVFAQNVTVSQALDTYELRLEGLAVQDGANGRELKVKLVNRSSKALRTLSFTVASDGSTPAVEAWTATLNAGATLNYSFAMPPEMDAAGDRIVCVWAEDAEQAVVSNKLCAAFSDAFSLLNPAPNPAAGEFRLAFILPGAGEVKAELVDPLGRLVAAAPSSVRYSAGYNEQMMSIIHLAKGLYFIRLSFNGQVQVKRLFIE